MISSTLYKRSKSNLFSLAKRFYAPGTEPKVFVNKYTKVICQGVTGKHVSRLQYLFGQCCLLILC